jgi:uncharacterized membrane protein YedE/YeeE
MTTKPDTQPEQGGASPLPYWSPYAAGFGLGITLLLAFRILGTGLGASGGMARVAAWVQHAFLPEHVERSAYFGAWFGPDAAHVLKYYLVFMSLGTLAGAFLSALGSRRIRPMLERGPRASGGARIVLALVGGVLVGFASRLARGCTSGQALTGTAMLFTGSVVFLLALFAGAYLAAWFVRREWR